MKKNEYLMRSQGLSRRDIAKQLAYATLGVTVLEDLPKIRGEKPVEVPQLAGFGKAKRVIWLQMLGGMTHLDTFDPKKGATAGPTKAVVAKAAGFELGHYMKNIAEHHSNQMTVIRSMTSKTGVHESGQYLMRTGYEKRGTIMHPNLGAWGQNLLGKSHQILPSSVCIGRNPDRGNGFMSAEYSPLPILSPESGLQNAKLGVNEQTMAQRLNWLNAVDSGFRQKYASAEVKSYNVFYEETLKLLASDEIKVFDINKENKKTKELYGQDKFAQGCLLARRLVQNGVRFVEVADGGWDMHNDLADEIEEKGAVLDAAIHSLLVDLEQQGLLDTTLVVLCTEFGRTPKINSRNGRDHHPKVFSTALFGAGIKAGTVYGASDATGEEVAKDPVTIQDFHTTVGYLMGLDVNREVLSPSERPFSVGNEGQVISGVIS